jgi:hypothetical protein
MAGESEINTATPPAFPRKYRPQTTTFENTHEAVQGIPKYADATTYDGLTTAQISGSGTAAAGSAINLAGLLPGGLYEFRFFNNTGKTTSQFPSANVCFKYGTGAATTDQMLPIRAYPLLQRMMPLGQTGISFINADGGAGTALYIEYTLLG